MGRRPPRSTLFPYTTPFRSTGVPPSFTITTSTGITGGFNGTVGFTAAPGTYTITETGGLDGFVFVSASCVPGTALTMSPTVTVTVAPGDQTPLCSFTNRSDEHTAELQSRQHRVCRPLL